jgi:DNA-binding protein H-NS
VTLEALLKELETHEDDELRGVITRSDEILKTRDKERKEQAVEQARAILQIAGLTFQDAVAKAKNGKAKPPVYRGGFRYQHPSKPELVWLGKGQKPNWLRTLEREGGRAVELPPEPPSDKPKAPVSAGSGNGGAG